MLDLKKPCAREPSDKPPDTTSAGADAILGGRGRWHLSGDQPAKSTTQSTSTAFPWNDSHRVGLSRATGLAQRSRAIASDQAPACLPARRSRREFAAE